MPYENILGELKPADIPDVFELEAKLDIALPQDKLQQSNVATMLTSGEIPLISKNYARETFLRIDQPSAMTEEVWTERAAEMKDIHFNQQQLMMDDARQQGLEEVLQVFSQMPPQMIPQVLQQIMQSLQPPEQGAPGQEGPPQGPPPGPPPQQQGGLPPEQFQGGGQPPLEPAQPEGAPILPPTNASPTEV